MFGYHFDWDRFIALLAIGVAGFGAFTAWLGVNTWRHELYGKEQYRMARRILRQTLLFYQVVGKLRATVYSDMPALVEYQNAALAIQVHCVESVAILGKKFKPLSTRISRLALDLTEARQFALLKSLDENKAALTKSEDEQRRLMRIAVVPYDTDEFRNIQVQLLHEIEDFVEPFLRR